ncbi:hypothetical protein UCRPC4_g06933 [Phaeomoniella chlamydospora]|uniref:Uncharacterized protein n=1 Tax=Phaeomoniella chlamydospora TaxID=158046 RepID=A0A0G2DU14_PHACM|nr:hypothetical protein UCRPC4_g06933 [Phaeomoniella chlamydospora]
MMNHMKDVVWKYAASDKVTFQSTCLALTSGHRARFLPTESNIKSADYYARVTEPDLEIYLRTTRDHENVKAEKFTMVRTSQAMWEARFGSPERSHDYITAAITLVQQQQSMHPVVVTWLHYAYYMSQFHAQPSSIRVLASDASMFAMFFQNAEQLSMHQGNHTWSNRVPLRRQLFKRRSPLWKLLSAPTRRSVEVNEPLEDYPWVIMKSHKNGVAAIARLACLLYINATLLDLRWSYDHTAAYLKHLEDKVLVHEVDRYPSVEPFIWVLLEQEPNPEVRSHDRPLIVGKLLRISRKLRPEVCDWLSEVLLRNLSLELEGQTPEMGQWEGMLRQELLKIPDAASSALG